MSTHVTHLPIQRGRRILTGVVILLIVGGATGFVAAAAARSQDAPVATVGSSTSEQIAALEFQINEAKEQLSQLGADDPASESVADRISMMEERVSSLCGQLEPSESAAVDGCTSSG
jgi:hypothetical protein